MPADASRSNFGLLELCTACAALVIVLGLSVSLARRVRSNDSQAAFMEQLARLNAALDRYGVPDELAPFADALDGNEEMANAAVHTAALRNSESWIGPLHLDPADGFDPWGMPVVLLDGPHPQLGMALHLRAFFMSAGPDGRYFSLADNIYGYDVALNHRPPATRPSGHGE